MNGSPLAVERGMSPAIQVSRCPSRRRPLEGRVALVTGGGRGIGRAIAAELLRRGATVVIGDLIEPEMKQTCHELGALGTVDWVELDVSDQASRSHGISAIHQKHGAVDILVNNAGIAGAGLFAEQDPARISKEVAVDLTGPLCLTRLVLPAMIANRWGRIVNISSMMAVTGSPGFAVYSAAKAGLLGFSQAVERELRAIRQIRVTAVLPPSVRTNAFEEAKRSHAAMMRWAFVPPISAKQVARHTVNGLIQGRRVVYCAAQSYAATLLQRFFPWILDRVLMFMFREHPAPRLPAAGHRTVAPPA